MRRRLALLVSAVTAMVLVAFVIPLAIVVRLIIADRALADATDVVRSVSGVVATGADPASVQRAAVAASRPVTVFLHGQRPLGAPVPPTPAVRLAERGQSFTVADPRGREILVAVQGLTGGPAVVRTFVSNADLTRGVTEAWLILAALGIVLLGLGVAVADRLVGSVTRPIGELARVSHVLAAGDLDARASPDGPPEVREVATGLNHLAGRIRDLIWQEREQVATSGSADGSASWAGRDVRDDDGARHELGDRQDRDHGDQRGDRHDRGDQHDDGHDQRDGDHGDGDL